MTETPTQLQTQLPISGKQLFDVCDHLLRSECEVQQAMTPGYRNERAAFLKGQCALLATILGRQGWAHEIRSRTTQAVNLAGSRELSQGPVSRERAAHDLQVVIEDLYRTVAPRI